MGENLFTKKDFTRLLANPAFNADQQYGLTDEAFDTINALKEQNKLFNPIALGLIKTYITNLNTPKGSFLTRPFTIGRQRTSPQAQQATRLPNGQIPTNNPLNQSGTNNGSTLGSTLGGRLRRTLRKNRRKTVNKR